MRGMLMGLIRPGSFYQYLTLPSASNLRKRINKICLARPSLLVLFYLRTYSHFLESQGATYHLSHVWLPPSRVDRLIRMVLPPNAPAKEPGIFTVFNAKYTYWPAPENLIQQQ